MADENLNLPTDAAAIKIIKSLVTTEAFQNFINTFKSKVYDWTNGSDTYVNKYKATGSQESNKEKNSVNWFVTHTKNSTDTQLDQEMKDLVSLFKEMVYDWELTTGNVASDSDKTNGNYNTREGNSINWFKHTNDANQLDKDMSDLVEIFRNCVYNWENGNETSNIMFGKKTDGSNKSGSTNAYNWITSDVALSDSQLDKDMKGIISWIKNNVYDWEYSLTNGEYTASANDYETNGTTLKFNKLIPASDSEMSFDTISVPTFM